MGDSGHRALTGITLSGRTNEVARDDQWRHLVGHPDPYSTTRDRRWAAGLTNPKKLQLKAAPGLYRLTAMIDRQLEAFAGDGAVPQPRTVAEHLNSLLPPELAGRIIRDADGLLAYRNRLYGRGVTDLGIDDDGFTVDHRSVRAALLGPGGCERGGR